MPTTSKKGSLPYGWIVQTSRHYPDRVYYFNTFTGVSSWECPQLDPPRVLTDEEVATMNNKNPQLSSRLNADDPPQSSDRNNKLTPPTAVVVPVVHEKKLKQPISDSQEQPNKKRKQMDSVGENSGSEVVASKKGKKNKKKKKKKAVSPLQKKSEEIVVPTVKVPPTKASAEGTEQSRRPSVSSTNESIKDVEMRDVSMDLLDDLNEKKETVFDTTACYYIVVDTNILISELHLISELKDTPLDGCGPPHIFIPWIVIEELDKLKSPKNPKGNIRALSCEAVRYLNSVLGKHPRFHGQSPAEAEEWAKTYSKCNDDKILECCVALMDKMPAEKVILLTNDKNLVNKALICKINVHNFESLMQKVKPDTVFDYEEMKTGKKKKKERITEEIKSPSILNIAEERFLQCKRDVCKREIHSIMSNARLLLKDVLFKFFCEEMNRAYDADKWVHFKIETKLLKGILEGIKRYWRTVFSEFFSEKVKRNFELLLEKATRPEGFLGDKEESLVILSAIEDVFHQIQNRQPRLKVPIEQIQDYRVACVNAFVDFSDAERSIRTVEEKNIRSVLDTNWTAINQLSGIILDHYNVPHNLNYEKISQPLSEAEIRRIMIDFYPGVQQFRNLLRSINDAVKNCKPVKSLIKKFHSALFAFIPSLRLNKCDPFTNSPFTVSALERFFTSPQNRETVEIGLEQIENFHSKLDEVLRIMLLPHLRAKNPVPETMICD